jgi:hypothetical protein
MPDAHAAPTLTPRTDSVAQRARSEFPALPANAPFLLAYHPARWTVMEDENGTHYCIPQLGRLSLMPGVDRVDRVRGGINNDDAISSWRRRGWHPIEDSSEYLRAVQVPGGRHHMTAWETAYNGDNRTETDVPGYAEWAASIADRMSKNGHPPAMVSLRRLRVRFQELAVKAKDRGRHSQAEAAKADKFARCVDAVDAAVKRFGGERTAAAAEPVSPDEDVDQVQEVEAKPKPKRRSTKSSGPTPVKET